MAISLARDIVSKPQRAQRGYTATQSGQLTQGAHVVISPFRQASGALVFDKKLRLRVYAGEGAVKTMVEAARRWNLWPALNLLSIQSRS
jgi:hypothetical protein